MIRRTTETERDQTLSLLSPVSQSVSANGVSAGVFILLKNGKQVKMGVFEAALMKRSAEFTLITFLYITPLSPAGVTVQTEMRAPSVRVGFRM